VIPQGVAVQEEEDEISGMERLQQIAHTNDTDNKMRGINDEGALARPLRVPL